MTKIIRNKPVPSTVSLGSLNPLTFFEVADVEWLVAAGSKNTFPGESVPTIKAMSMGTGAIRQFAPDRQVVVLEAVITITYPGA